MSVVVFRLVLGLCVLSQIALANANTHLRFVGDILLTREVEREVELTNLSPWHKLPDLAQGPLIGNFEGVFGEASDCAEGQKNCFAVKKSYLQFLQEAGFTALSLANNHSADLGNDALHSTVDALAAADIAPLTFARSPSFIRLNQRSVALIALNLVPGRDGSVSPLNDFQWRQKIRLANAFSAWTIVIVHWGIELQNWPSSTQQQLAQQLIAAGADVIIGSHPHVVQHSECIDGHPVFYSLGNHVFDQKYPLSKQGLVVDCTEMGNRLQCDGRKTMTKPESAFPEWDSNSVSAVELPCSVAARTPLSWDGTEINLFFGERNYLSGQFILATQTPTPRSWQSQAIELHAAENVRFQHKDQSETFLFTLERHLSSLDKEFGLRPYVYTVTPRGLIARWRGSALAWPLVDAQAFVAEDGNHRLCVLHRNDSFLKPDVNAVANRVMVYKWNGFGFVGDSQHALMAKCQVAYGLGAPPSD